ncbi:hypothetical protein [Phaffia rhodozyma]|uniref:Uncharacterized protein n=1 Tax=Phaffia rhodozyma TaxID=264483 RepID=A0A0F7SWN0_PHARH|nr:hypothetical protein [Phaffia rhodozyma]
MASASVSRAFLPVLAVTLVVLPIVQAFTFTFNNTIPSVCDRVLVEWSGGSPPFKLLIIPAYDYPSEITLSNSTWDSSDSTGSYIWDANYPVGTRYVAVMSDSNGLATGGVSSIMTIQSTPQTESCTIRSEKADFFFYLDPESGSVNQCDTLGIGWTNNATNPVQLIGVIPNGNAFVLPATDLYWNWTVNIRSSTTYILTMLDAGPVGNGGSSNFLTVGSSTDSSCLDAASPSQTPGSTWGTPEGKAATTAKAPSSTKTSKSSESSTPRKGIVFSTGVIAGIVVAALLGLVGLQLFIFWYFCGNRFRRTLVFDKKHEGDVVGQPVTSSGRRKLFGRKDGDVSSFQPDPYIADPSPSTPSGSNGMGPKNGRRNLLLLDDGDETGESNDPFTDEQGYMYPGSARMYRRGSDQSASGNSDGHLLVGTEGGSRSANGSRSMDYLREGPLGTELQSISSPLISHPPLSLSGFSTSHSLAVYPPYTDSDPSPSSPTYASYSNLTSASSYPTDSSVPFSPSDHCRPGSDRATITPSVVRQTKAMMALSNSDREPPDEADRIHSMSGYVRHRDAGPVETDGPPELEGEMVELPPMYDEIQRGREDRHRGRTNGGEVEVEQVRRPSREE